jgi:hypothetical protein
MSDGRSKYGARLVDTVADAQQPGDALIVFRPKRSRRARISFTVL